MYKVLIGDSLISVSLEDIENSSFSYDRRTQSYQVLHNKTIHKIKLDEGLPVRKYQNFYVDDLPFNVVIQNELDQLVDSLGLSSIEEVKSKNISAPMPGLILDIMVNVGDEVKAGSSLLILEAMKMENVIKAEGNGTISKIHASKGETVEKGKLIIEIE